MLNLRQSDGLGDNRREFPKSMGLSSAFGCVVLERRFQTKAQLIDAILSKDVRLVQREELSLAGVGMYPKLGMVLPPQCGFPRFCVR